MKNNRRIGLIVIVVLTVAAVAQQEQGAEQTLRHYIELRLNWADWKDYSRFITWPDEPGWDCWWVAKGYEVGKVAVRRNTATIPVTYSRVGRFCADFQLEIQSQSETIVYELIHQRGRWKINGPVPDYPYISQDALAKWLAQRSSDPKESETLREQARQTLQKLQKQRN